MYYNPPAPWGLKVNIQFFSWQNPQNQYFSQKWQKVTQIDVFRTSHNSCLEGPNPKISKPIIKPLPLAFRQKKIWANSTFLWAANRDSAQVIEKSVKSEAKYHETGQNFKTSKLGLGMNFLDIFGAQNDCLVVGYYYYVNTKITEKQSLMTVLVE